MFIPIRTDRPLRSTPAVNFGLIAANILIFLVQQATPALEARFLLYPADPTLTGFLGSAFLHANLMHLAGNMLFLYIFGNNLNDRLGNAGYLALYVGGALAAGLLHVATENSPVLGASGAVAAVSGAFLVLFPRTRIMVLVVLFLITFVQIPSLWFIGLYVLIFDVLGGLGGMLLGGESGIAHFAHIGGTLYGIVIAFLLLGSGLVDRDQFDLLSLLKRRKLRKEHAAALRATGQSHGSGFDIVPAAKADPKLAPLQDLREKINAAIERENLREAGKLYSQLRRIDPRQVLARRSQLDVANQLAADARHADAAPAYELFLQHHPHDPEADQAQLMLGLIYARYLDRPDDARRHLGEVAPRLEDLAERQIAEAELARLAAPPA